MNCSKTYESTRYDIALGLRSSLSFISCAFTVCMIFIIILFKKYHFFTQRLLLYLALSCMLNLLSAGFNLSGRESYTSKSALYYCMAVGFSEQLTIWWTILATFCIVIALFIQAICGKSTHRFELGYLLLIFGFPLSFCWIPFYYGAYGPDDMFCWIRELNLNNCSQFMTGEWLRYSLYYIPLSLLMLLLVALYVPVVIIVHRKKNRWAGLFNPEAIAIQRMIATEIRPLIYYPLIILVINAFPLIKQIYATASGNHADITVYFYISLVSYIIYPFQGAFITLAFTLDPETRQLLTWRRFVSALLQCCTKERVVKEYPVTDTLRSDSLSVEDYGSNGETFSRELCNRN